jgi:hypothetical protein
MHDAVKLSSDPQFVLGFEAGMFFTRLSQAKLTNQWVVEGQLQYENEAAFSRIAEHMGWALSVSDSTDGWLTYVATREPGAF